MNKNKLFPQINGILHGGDYNAEQWLDRPDILAKDIEMMKEAGMTSATLGVFSWSAYEPVEGEYHFDWLKDVMDNLYNAGIYTVLATPSGGKPAWMAQKYPEIRRVDSYDVREHQGVRENHCMSSPIYREKVDNIIRQLHAHVGNHPGLIMWHVSNELGGECYCRLCVKRFQNYLAEKFDHDINKLNKAWWTTFWSHSYNDFSQIEPPYKNGDFSIMGLNLEWKRFTTWNMNDYMKSEIKLLRELTPDIPITTNFMQLYDGLDYRPMAKELDVISWDSYPRFHNDYESLADVMGQNTFDHAVMRSMKKDKPFMLMESAPGLVNWHPYNKLKRPGIHRLFSYNAIACGSDTVQYFQWRKGRGSFEQYHGAVVDHLGTNDTRIFKEVAALGAELDGLSEITGTLIRSKVALLFDWDNMWAIDDVKALGQESKKYPETCMSVYKELTKRGIDVDIIASDESLDDYDVVVAPMLYMLRDGAAESLAAFVKRGGQLLATYFTGYVDKDQLCILGGFPGNGLADVFGIISEEIDTLYPSDRNSVSFTDGSSCELRDYAEILRVGTADVLGTYDSDFYAGNAAVTVNSYGKGKAYYVAARIDYSKFGEIMEQMLVNADIAIKDLPDGVQYHCRYADDGTAYCFYLNNTDESQSISDVHGTNIQTQNVVDGELELPPLGVAIIKEKQLI